jgi:hypothetical protein
VETSLFELSALPIVVITGLALVFSGAILALSLSQTGTLESSRRSNTVALPRRMFGADVTE